jgi:hypothetical protein
MALAMSSLPVPLSPTIRLGASVRATLRTCSMSRRMLSLRPSRCPRRSSDSSSMSTLLPAPTRRVVRPTRSAVPGGSTASWMRTGPTKVPLVDAWSRTTMPSSLSFSSAW